LRRAAVPLVAINQELQRAAAPLVAMNQGSQWIVEFLLRHRRAAIADRFTLVHHADRFTPVHRVDSS
jgi:hypothetical protein